MSGRGEYSKVGPYILLETLGSGSFGKVKLAVHETTHERFACKILDKSLVRQRVLNKQVKKEISIMQTLDHRNTVSVVSVLSTHSKVFLVMELVSGGELFDEILRHRRLSEPYARFYFQQLIDGLQHCHEHGVYHRDLKPENLLLDENKTLKITDFGLSTLCSEPGSLTGSLLLHTRCGTPNYVAPEMIIDEPIGYSGAKVDVWSCGIILFVLIAGALPFDADDTDDLFARILRRDIKYPPWFSSSLIDLIGNILADPDKRYSLADIRRHPWFNGHVETSMCGESLEPTFAVSDIPAPLPPVPGDSGVMQSPEVAHVNPNDHLHAPSSTQTGQASLLSQYVHMPVAGQGQLGAPKMSRRIDSLDFGIRAESEDGNFGNHGESRMRQTDAAPILPAAISENPLPDNHSTYRPSDTELNSPIDLPEGGKNHIEKFRSRVSGQRSGSSVKSSDDDHESEFEDAQEVSASHRVEGNNLRSLKGKASQTYGSESRQRGHSWNQDFLQSTTNQGTVPECDDVLSRSSDGDPSIRRFVKRELWNHDADSWREPKKALGDFGETIWDYDNDRYHQDNEVGRHFLAARYDLEHGQKKEPTLGQGSNADSIRNSAGVGGSRTAADNNDTLETEFVPRTFKLIRAVSCDGIALSAKTRRRSRPRREGSSRKNRLIVTIPPQVSVHQSVQGSHVNDDVRGIVGQNPQTKKILRIPANQRPQKRERTRQNTVRFNDVKGQDIHDRRGCESDRDWVESDVGKMLWCRMMKDYDMIPDSDEFDMDSLALNKLWTSGLQRERIGKPGSFAAQRFGSRKLTLTRSTQYLASQVQRSEVERWGSLAAGKTAGDSISKGQNGSKGPHEVVFRDPSPSSAVASNSSSPTSVREDGETRSGVSRTLSVPAEPVGAINTTARSSGVSGGMRGQIETSTGHTGNTSFSEGAHRSHPNGGRDKELSSIDGSSRNLDSKFYEGGRQISVSPHPSVHKKEIVNKCGSLLSIPGHVLTKVASPPTMSSLRGSSGTQLGEDRERIHLGTEWEESSDGIRTRVTVAAPSSIMDNAEEPSKASVSLGGNRDLLQGDDDHHEDESDDDEYQSEGASGTIGAEPPPGDRQFGSQGIDLRQNNTRDNAIQSTGSGTASSSEAFRNTNIMRRDLGHLSEKASSRPAADHFSVQSSDSSSVTSSATKLGRQTRMERGEIAYAEAKNIQATEREGYRGFEVDEVAATASGIPRSRSSPWNVGAREDADSMESGGPGSASSGGDGQSRRTSRSASRRDMNVVSPFSMEIPGPRRRLGSYGGISGVGVLFPRVGSARRFFEKQPPPMYGSKVTLFHSVLKPGRCYSLLRELLHEYGCAVQGPSVQRGRKRFTIKCEMKKDEVNIGAVIRICGYDDVLSSVTFKKKPGCDSEAFERFYTNIHEMYRERSKGMSRSSALPDSSSGPERKVDSQERVG